MRPAPDAATLPVASVTNGEEERMDFNTGGSGGQNPDDPSRPLYSSGPSGPSPRPAGGPTGGSGGEFNLSDPVGSFVATVRSIVLNPVGFFRDMPRRGGFVNPLVFALISAVIYGVLTGILSFLINLVSGNGFGIALGSLFGYAIGAPIITVISLFIGAGIYHLLVMLLVRPSNAGFEATFRVVAYSSVVQLVNWLGAIPILGVIIALAAGVYGVILGVLGIREAHNTTTGRAVLVILIPTAIVVLLLLLVIGSVLLLIFAGSQQ